MSLTLHTPDVSGELSAFHQMAADLYADDPCALTSSRNKTERSLERPEFAGRQKIFVITENGVPCARAVARVSPTLTDPDGMPLGMIGYFEAHENRAAIHMVLDAALDWLSHKEVATVVGPMDGDTWHRYRFMSGPFDERPFLMEPYNKPWYAEAWEAYGFDVLESYYSKAIRDGRVGAAAEALAPHRKRAEKRFRFRRIDMSCFDQELRIIYDITVATFRENFLYTDVSFEEFLGLYEGVDALLDPDYVWFTETPEGEVIGFIFAIPDYFDAVAAMKGKRNLISKVRFLANKKKAGAVNIKTLGVRPEWQRSGAAVAMMQIVYEEAAAQGYSRCNLCLIREGNPSGRMDGGQGDVMRHYNLYTKKLS